MKLANQVLDSSSIKEFATVDEFSRQVLNKLKKSSKFTVSGDVTKVMVDILKGTPEYKLIIKVLDSRLSKLK